MDEDRNQNHMVGSMRIAHVRVVVQECIAFTNVLVQFHHVLPQWSGAEHVHRDAFCRCEKLVVCRQDGAREIARGVDDGGSSRTQQAAGHFADNAVKRVGKHRELYGIKFARHGYASLRVR